MLYTKEQTQNIQEQTFAYLQVEEADHVLRITLDRPAKKNALNPVMLNELAYAMYYARHHHSVWAVIIKAEGDVFCAGADLKAFMGSTEETSSSVPQPEGEVLIGELFNKLYKPCIAQVEANVYAGGMLILAGCTHVVAEDGIQFGLPEVKRGLFPFQVLASLMEVIPARKALDWCIRGYDLKVEQAMIWGLVTHLTMKGKAEEEVRLLLDDILANAPTAIRKGLEAYDEIRKHDTAKQHQYLRNMLIQTLQTKDAQEGLKAFREKREPKWTGE